MAKASGYKTNARGLRRCRVFASCASFGLFAGALILGTTFAQAEQPPATDERSAATVELVFDFDDGALKTYRLDWKEGKTITHYLLAAKVHKRGVKMELRGRGETAFLVSVDGLKNEGAGGKNWIYRVNDRLGTKSFGLQTLKQDDRVLWKFGNYR